MVDWDDTIIDTFDAMYHAINDTVRRINSRRTDTDPIQPITPEQWEGIMGTNDETLFNTLFGKEGWTQHDLQHYWDTIDEGELVYMNGAEKILSTLQSLKHHGIDIAVVSNKNGHVLRREIAALGIGECFSTVVGRGDCGNDADTNTPVTKPSPKVLDTVLASDAIRSRPQNQRNDIWMIGDSASDLMFADNIGARFLGVGNKISEEQRDTYMKHGDTVFANLDIMARTLERVERALIQGSSSEMYR
jgi:phosphoglycolate phosphatase